MNSEVATQPEASVAQAKRKPSFLMVLGLALCLIWATGLALVTLHPTARLRAAHHVDAWLTAVGRGGTAPGDSDPEAVVESEEGRLATLAAGLEAERLRLEQWAAGLAVRDTAITEAEGDLALREAILAQEVEQLTATVADLGRLARLCRQMKPADAAAILEPLDDPHILAVLRGLSDADAAKILTAMSPQRASDLIKLLTPQELGSAG